MDDLTRIAVLLSLEQAELDTLLKRVSGTWWFDCNCDCKTNNARIALLLITRWLAEKNLDHAALSQEAKKIVCWIWSLSFLMVESGAYEHFNNFADQSEYENAFAQNWLLMSYLCVKFCSETATHQSTAHGDFRVEELFTRYGRKLA